MALKCFLLALIVVRSLAQCQQDDQVGCQSGNEQSDSATLLQIKSLQANLDDANEFARELEDESTALTGCPRWCTKGKLKDGRRSETLGWLSPVAGQKVPKCAWTKCVDCSESIRECAALASKNEPWCSSSDAMEKKAKACAWEGCKESPLCAPEMTCANYSCPANHVTQNPSSTNYTQENCCQACPNTMPSSWNSDFCGDCSMYTASACNWDTSEGGAWCATGDYPGGKLKEYCSDLCGYCHGQVTMCAGYTCPSGYINIHLSSTTITEANCCEEATTRTTTTSTTTTTTRANCDPTVAQVISSGTCASHGMVSINNVTACTEIAAAICVGIFPYRPAYLDCPGSPGNCEGRPTGCIIGGDVQFLGYNSVSTEHDCGKVDWFGVWKCICLPAPDA